jgi:hypothetical protein
MLGYVELLGILYKWQGTPLRVNTKPVNHLLGTTCNVYTFHCNLPTPNNVNFSMKGVTWNLVFRYTIHWAIQAAFDGKNLWDHRICLMFMNPCLVIQLWKYQQDVLYRLIYYSKSALHVSDDVFAHHQKHLTVFRVYGSVHPSCCRLVSHLMHQPAATLVNTTRYCKYSQLLLIMGENIARNM